MNQKQVKELFKESKKKSISKTELPVDIQRKLTSNNYIGIQEQIRENADLLLLQDEISEEPKILLLLEREPYGIEIIKEFS